MFATMIVLGYSCTVFMNQNIRNHQNYKIMRAFSFLNDRSKFMNLEAVLAYFKRRPQKLNHIINMVDESCAQETQWTHYPEAGYFVFKGVLGIGNKRTEYIVNIENGIVLKNGR